MCGARRYGVAIHQKVSVTGQDSVCKAVTNNSDTGLGLFVPTQTLDEWQTFYSNTPTGIQLSVCTCQAQTSNSCYANPPPPPPVPPNNLCSAQSSCAVHCTAMGFDYSGCTSPFSFAGKTWNCMCGKYSDATVLGLGFCSGCQ